MSQAIKAISTKYVGPTGRSAYFRSRLEARWAVVFDWLGLAWEYETQGWSMNGECYLPDFYIYRWDAFVEIKSRKKFSGKELDKMIEFSVHRELVVLRGNPHAASICTFDRKSCYEWAMFQCYGCNEFACGPYDTGKFKGHANHIYLDTLTAIKGERASIRIKPKTNGKVIGKCPFCRHTTQWGISSEYKRAANAAQSARFEFGEHGIDWSIKGNNA